LVVVLAWREVDVQAVLHGLGFGGGPRHEARPLLTRGGPAPPGGIKPGGGGRGHPLLRALRGAPRRGAPPPPARPPPRRVAAGDLGPAVALRPDVVAVDDNRVEAKWHGGTLSQQAG